MSKIEQSIQEAIRKREQTLPWRRPEPLPPQVAPVVFNQEEREVHLKDYLDILLRRKLIVIVFLVCVVTTVTIISFLMTPLYKSSVVIQLRGGKTELVDYKEVYQEQSGLETQYNVLESKSLATRVAKNFPENEYKGVIGQPSFDLKKKIMSIIDFSKEEPVDFADNAAMISDNAPEKQKYISAGQIRSGVEIEPIKKTNLVRINFVSPDPVFSADAANAYAEEYFNFTHENKLKPTLEGAERLRKQVEEMRLKLEKSERDLHEYVGESEYIVSSNDQKYEDLLANKFSEISKELDTAVADRIRKETEYVEVQKTGITYKSIINNPIIQPLIKKQVELESEYAKLLIIHKPEYPKMVRLREQIIKTQEQIKTEENALVDSVKAEYYAALNKENTLSNITDEIRKQMSEFQGKLSEFLRMQREVESNRGIYNSLLQRLKEVEINVALEKNDVQILDRASVSSSPYKPQKALNFMLSIIFGLLGGSFLAFFIEYFDDSIKSDIDVERSVQLPVYGAVPLLKEGPKDVINFDPNEHIAFSDALRSIGTRLHFANMENQPKHIMITSPLPDEGKSLIAASISVSLLTTHGKGLIIDTDLRKPHVHRLFNLDNSVGLSSFLSGAIPFQNLIKVSPYPGLDVITSGPVPLNSSELMYSSRMRELVDILSINYDYVIFDSSPVLGIADSIILSTICSGVILVVRALKTPKEALIKSRKALMSVNANTLGVVINGTDLNGKLPQTLYSSAASENQN